MRHLNAAAEDSQIEAKGADDLFPFYQEGRRATKENYRTLMESICAFSNEPDLGGGVILLGVGETTDDDESRFIVEGVTHLDKVQCDIATQCKTIFNHPVYPTITVERVNRRHVLKIVVPELPIQQKPLFFKNLGLPKGAFRRIGSSDLCCTHDDLSLFYGEPSVGYDSTPVPGARVDEIDPEALKRYRQLRAQINPAADELLWNDQEVLESLGCVCPENKEQLNLAGVLLFGSAKLQRRTIPMTRIDYIRVPGNEWVSDPERSFRSIDMLGPLLLTLYRLVDAVNADLPKGFLLREGELQADSLGLPVRVLREAIVNAMMHRSYREHQPTQIIRYDNRIEIKNAGFSLKDIEELGLPGSKIRNRILAAVFHDTNLAEAKGSGIRRMRELMKKAHLAQPTFESNRDRNEFTIRLLLHHFLGPEDIAWLEKFKSENLNDAQKAALVFIREVGAIDNSIYRQMWNCDTLKASGDLRKLRDKGFLEAKGRGSATYYIPGERIRPCLTPQAPALIPQAPALTPQANSETPQAQTSSCLLPDLPSELQEELLRMGKRISQGHLKEIIFKLCVVRALTRQEIANLLSRNESNLKKPLKEMLESGRLKYLHPEMIKHPQQAYMAVKSSVKSSVKIIEAVRQDPFISADVMAKTFGVSLRAVEKQLASLKKQGLLRRIGPDKGGHWEVVEKRED